MLKQREVHYVDSIAKNLECVMVSDIGGTNSNFGFFSITHYTHGFESTLLFSLHIKSQEITDFTTVVSDILNYVKKTYGMISWDAIYLVHQKEDMQIFLPKINLS